VARRGQSSGMRERAPWYRRRVGLPGAVAVALIASSAIIGFATHGSGSSRTVQAALLLGGAAAYLIGLARSPD
jgi:hypothetical protein